MTDIADITNIADIADIASCQMKYQSDVEYLPNLIALSKLRASDEVGSW